MEIKRWIPMWFTCDLLICNKGAPLSLNFFISVPKYPSSWGIIGSYIIRNDGATEDNVNNNLLTASVSI